MPIKTRVRKSKRGSRKTAKCRSTQKTHIVRVLLEMLNVVKLYHWKTRSYPEHIATDELYGKLNGHVDTFVEVYLGKDGSRIQHWNDTVSIVQYHRKRDFKSKMFYYREFLMDLNQCLDSRQDSDLLNIRDEILGDLNQFLYLMTLNRG